jgi:hypothetical protein
MPGSDNEVLSPAEVRGTIVEWAQFIVQSYAEPEAFAQAARTFLSNVN